MSFLKVASQGMPREISTFFAHVKEIVNKDSCFYNRDVEEIKKDVERVCRTLEKGRWLTLALMVTTVALVLFFSCPPLLPLVGLSWDCWAIQGNLLEMVSKKPDLTGMSDIELEKGEVKYASQLQRYIEDSPSKRFDSLFKNTLFVQRVLAVYRYFNNR